MVSLAVPKALAETPDTTFNLPELSDAAYINEVLRLPVEKCESHVEDELVAKARQLGISTVAFSDKRYTLSAESASTVPTYHARTFSTGSRDSTSTALTLQSSLFTPPSPELSPTEANGKRRPKSTNFSQYEKYLTQVDKNLDQPKFRRPSITVDNSNKSLFSVNTRRSLASVRSGIKSRLRLRRKSVQPSIPSLYVVSIP